MKETSVVIRSKGTTLYAMSLPKKRAVLVRTKRGETKQQETLPAPIAWKIIHHATRAAEFGLAIPSLQEFAGAGFFNKHIQQDGEENDHQD